MYLGELPNYKPSHDKVKPLFIDIKYGVSLKPIPNDQHVTLAIGNIFVQNTGSEEDSVEIIKESGIEETENLTKAKETDKKFEKPKAGREWRKRKNHRGKKGR